MDNRGKRKCVICGKEFEIRAVNQVACSPECSHERDRMRKAERYDPKEVVNCIVCGKEFLRERRNIVCCSDECRKERIRAKNNEVHMNRKNKSKRNTLDKELKRLATYNAEHNTKLSYGQFKALEV